MIHLAEANYGRLLRVDLSIRRINVEQIESHILRQYIGGVGLGTKILYDEVPPQAGCFDPENRLVITTGPLVGTEIPGSAIYTVVTKGPLTGALGAAQANGFFGARLRYAGYDVIVVHGAAPGWLYLWIHDGQAELRSATHLIGLDTFETEDRLKAELGDRRASVACIGPSGEHMVRFAAICNDHGHVAATNGPGAIMGSKRLKAIVVAGDRANLGVADHEHVKAIAKQWRASAQTTAMGASIKMAGTVGGVAVKSVAGIAAVRNCTSKRMPPHEPFSWDYIRSRFRLTPHRCWSCNFNHCQDVEVTQGSYAGLTADLPEYEGMAGWGPLIGNEQSDAAIMLNAVNDRLGMDLKEASFTVALAMECYEKGLISSGDTDGFELTWGNVDTVAKLLYAIAHRRGFGDVLAEGVKRAGERIGGDAPKFGVYHKNGIAPQVHDVRHQWGAMLRQSVTDMGGSVSWEPEAPVIEGVGMTKAAAPFCPEEIALGVARTAPLRQFEESMNVCLFHLPAEREIETNGVSAAVGWALSPDEALTIGRRIVTLQRAFSLRHGLIPERDDVISYRLTQAVPEGKDAGKTIAPFFEGMKRLYYREMGWDEQTGVPLPETLRSLDLRQIVEDLASQGVVLS